MIDSLDRERSCWAIVAGAAREHVLANDRETIDPRRVRAGFTNAGHRIHAELAFNESGELTNFVSDDRSQTSPDGARDETASLVDTDQRLSLVRSSAPAAGWRTAMAPADGRIRVHPVDDRRRRVQRAVALNERRRLTAA